MFVSDSSEYSRTAGKKAWNRAVQRPYSEEESELGWLVDVEFRKSSIHGMGIFVRQAISAGTRLWEYDETMRSCDEAAFERLTPRERRFALHGGYLHKPSDTFLWYTDGMQFMNHRRSPDANAGLGRWPNLDEDHTTALRDIAVGEELTEDYTFWSDGGIAPDHWLNRFYLAHCPEHLAFLHQLESIRQAA